MISTKIARMKMNTINYENSACLFLYDDSILKTELFVTFVDELFKSAKVEKHGARAMVIEDDRRYISNKEFLKELYDHPNESHIVIFKDKKMVGYTPLDELVKLFKKSIK